MGSNSPVPPSLESAAGPQSVWSSRARTVYERVCGLDGTNRRQALDRECGDDWTLHAEVAALLAHDSHPSLPHRDPMAASTGLAPCPSDGLALDSIAGYRIGRMIGVGGSGTVYEAEQESPRRQVALKIFRAPRTDTRLRRRIAHEAEILARLHHPSIAHVYAVNAGSEGDADVPWIAMELVAGVPIDVWCREHATSLRARAELLATVAEAVAHAHASGVVHRDLKPSNVLVTDDGIAKVVDFGVARTLHDSPAVGTLHTRDGDLVGTLAYMAPEQVEGASSLVDTRTDVHALGTIAFEVLTGRRPRDPEWMTLPEWASALRRPAPSLQEVLPSAPIDLALVVAKALEPDQDRRYPTALAFADDLRRFLRDEPINARAPTRGYLLRSFVRRHRTLVLGAVATVLALAAGLAVSLAFAIESNTQRRRADAESDEARREAYRAQTSVAAEAIATGNASSARTALDRAPEAFRGWEWRHLDAQVDRCARRVRWAMGLERWMSASADGRRIAGGTSAEGAAVLDAATGAILCRIAATPAFERGVLVADGSRLVLARTDGALDVIDVATGRRTSLGMLTGRSGECDVLAATPRGATICESRCSSSPRLRFVDLDTGASWTRGGTDQWRWSSAAFNSTATELVAAVHSGAVVAIPTSGDAPVREVARHSQPATGAVWVPGSSRLISVSSDRRAIVATTDGSAAETTLALHQQGVFDVAASEDGGLLATWARERVVRLFRGSDLLPVGTRTAVGANEFSRVRFSPDAAEVSVDDPWERRTWFTRSETEFDVLRGHRSKAEGNQWPYIYGIAFAPDGRRVATGGWDGTVRIWSVVTGRALAVLEAPGPVHSVAWSPDGDVLISSGRPHHLVAFDSATGRRIATAQDGQSEMYGGLGFTHDGKTLWATKVPGDVCARDPRTLVRRGTPFTEAGDPWSVAVARNGAVAIGYGSGKWSRFEAHAPGRPGRAMAFEKHPLAVTDLAISPDGSLVAASSEDGTATIADAETGSTRFTIRGHVGRVYGVAFSPDGRRLATGGDDGTVRLHDVATGEELLSLRGHESYVFALAFAPDGETIASASGDNTARLWSTQTLAQRVARRDAALAAEAAVEPRVRAIVARTTDPRAAVDAVRALAGLDDRTRAAALDVALRILAATPSSSDK